MAEIRHEIWQLPNNKWVTMEEIKNDHLLNIIKWIEKKAEEGIRTGGGTCPEDFWFDDLDEDEVKNQYRYKEFVKEAFKRDLITIYDLVDKII